MSSKMEVQYEGAFLDALDLPEGSLVSVEIVALTEPGTEKDAAGKLIKQAILGFKGKTKRLILNKTNYRNLKAMFGRDDREWIGKAINIQRRYLDAKHGFGVVNTLCIRIIPPVGTPILRSAAQYMGQPHPYGETPPGPKRKPPVDQPRPEPKEEQPAELEQWLAAFEPLTTKESCDEFRRTMLPDCPANIRAEVEAALEKHEAALS